MLCRYTLLLQVLPDLHVLSEYHFEIGLSLHQIPNQVIQHLTAVYLPHLPHDHPLAHLYHLLHKHHL
jgi:hypothetical protein